MRIYLHNSAKIWQDDLNLWRYKKSWQVQLSFGINLVFILINTKRNTAEA
jgi:hypothetical protein